MSGNIAERVARLENEVENINKSLIRSDVESATCQTRQSVEFAKINARIELFINNELAHVTARIDQIESKRRDPLNWVELGKIVIAVVSAVGLVLATYIQYWRPGG